MGDANRGLKLFKKHCFQCHTDTKDGKHKKGPNLWGIFNKKSGISPNYKYSNAMKKAEITWNETALDGFIADPKAYVPGTSVVIPGIKSKQERTDIIEYLKTLK